MGMKAKIFIDVDEFDRLIQIERDYTDLKREIAKEKQEQTLLNDLRRGFFRVVFWPLSFLKTFCSEKCRK